MDDDGYNSLIFDFINYNVIISVDQTKIIFVELMKIA